MSDLDRFYRIIQKPVITEKATDGTVTRNTYTFRVPVDAGKIEVRRAVEKLFDVRVTSVNTLKVRGKFRRRGYTFGQTQEWKKAMVTLKDGDAIDVF